MRPRESYRAHRRNSRTHEARAKKLVRRDVIEEWRGKWNCYPENRVLERIPRVGSGPGAPGLHMLNVIQGLTTFRGFSGRNR